MCQEIQLTIEKRNDSIRINVIRRLMGMEIQFVHLLFIPIIHVLISSCAERALCFVSSWCVNLIRVFLHDDALH